MKHTHFFFLLLLILPFSVLAQNSDTLNYTDANGKKQGHWIKKYGNGNIQFEGYFKNNIPVGQMKKYHDNGNLKYDLYYNIKDPNSVSVTMFDAAGKLSAKGFYYAQKKDSTWLYFGENNKILLEENYNHGKLDGEIIVFWQTQVNQPMEIKSWKDSLKEGDWTWFYEDGKIRQKAHYTNDKLDGDFLVFFPDGSSHITGKYNNNIRDGVWSYFNEDGSSRAIIKYNNGKIENEDEYERAETKYLNEYLAEEGKHLDPEKFIDNPEAYIFGEQYNQGTEEKESKKKAEKSKK